MRVLSGQLGSSTQRLITIPRGTTLAVATADTVPELVVPQAIRLQHLGFINQIARNLFRTAQTPEDQEVPPTPIGLALQAIFGTWLTILDSIIPDDPEEGPTWHLIEGPIQLPLRTYNPRRGLSSTEAILGVGVKR